MIAPTSRPVTEPQMTSSTPTPPPLQTPPTLVQQPRASFKPPKLDTPAWSGQSANFYPWLSTILNRFNLTQAEDNVKVALTQNAILLASFLHYRF